MHCEIIKRVISVAIPKLKFLIAKWWELALLKNDQSKYIANTVTTNAAY